MTSSSIAEIMCDRVLPLGVEVYPKGSVPTGKVEIPRIVVLPRDVQDGVTWNRCFVDVNYCVPLICGEWSSDLGERERDLIDALLDGNDKHGYVTGFRDGERYRFKKFTSGSGDDKELNIAYANVRLLFEILNVN